MPDQADRPDRKQAKKEDLAPETFNSEQDSDADEQAQSVAQDALHRHEQMGLEESEKISTGDLSDDSQDLVDRMKQMDTSGQIDMDAYRGEPNFDDEEEKYGKRSSLRRKRKNS